MSRTYDVVVFSTSVIQQILEILCTSLFCWKDNKIAQEVYLLTLAGEHLDGTKTKYPLRYMKHKYVHVWCDI